MTEEKTEEYCTCCGASMKSYHHALSSGLVSALIKSIKFVQEDNKNLFHLQNDLTSLTKNEYNNFQKLRFHGLVAKTDKAGYWLITKRGGMFLRGEMAVPKTVQTFRNEVIGHSEETVTIRDFAGKVPEFQCEFGYSIIYQSDMPVKATLF